MSRVRHARQTVIAFGLAAAVGMLAVSSQWMTRAEGGGDEPAGAFTPAQRDHWAYQPIRRQAPPTARRAGWARNAIDLFLLQGLEAQELAPSPEADRVALIRRLTFDLTGLPPSPEQVEAFVSDTHLDAYERLVDRLLASPAYGQRWAQHWLDLAHYADSNGFELDADRPDAWRYRDWVVDALNGDLPYTEFVSLQLAGDELRPDDPQALIATGFGRCGPREVVGGNIDPEVRRQSELTEVTGTVGSVFLGLTVACARCHDHKFDAISARDYYSFQAFFAAAQLIDQPIASDEEQARHATAKKALDERLAPLKAELAELEAPFRKALRAQKEQALTAAESSVLAVPAAKRTPLEKKMAAGAEKALNVTWEEVAEAAAHDPVKHADRERIKREIFELEQTGPPPLAHAMALMAKGEKPTPPTFILQRGDPKKKGDPVDPRPPAIVMANVGNSGGYNAAAPEQSRGRRSSLAAWIASPENPLPARVIVNRLWQHHFGKGIVATPSDFGVRGEPPTHPELLDWLAAELIENGWKLKPLHRLMLTSAAYRQVSGTVDPAQSAADEENQLVGRMNRRRLDAEGVRDAQLFVSGELFSKMGGPGVRPPIEKEIESLIFTEAEVVDLWPETADSREHARRSLYLYRKRNVRYPLFDAFDAPDTQSACPQRDSSTHAIQPLVLLNSEFAIARARALAGRTLREANGTEPRIDRLYRLVLSRPPRPGELSQARAFLDAEALVIDHRLAEGAPVVEPTYVPPELLRAQAVAWVDLCLAMLNRTEFLYVP
jgi:hypothetical protein